MEQIARFPFVFMGATKNQRCFWIIIAPLFLPQITRLSNSRGLEFSFVTLIRKRSTYFLLQFKNKFFFKFNLECS